jgi:hypothetical protein
MFLPGFILHILFILFKAFLHDRGELLMIILTNTEIHERRKNYRRPRFLRENFPRSHALRRMALDAERGNEINEIKNSIFTFVFVFLCVLGVFAVQGFLILQHSQGGRGDLVTPAKIISIHKRSFHH